MAMHSALRQLKVFPALLAPLLALGLRLTLAAQGTASVDFRKSSVSLYPY